MPDIQHQVTQYKYITYLHSVLNGNRSHCINGRALAFIYAFAVSFGGSGLFWFGVVCVAPPVVLSSSSIDIKTHVIQSARMSAFDTKENHFKIPEPAKRVRECVGKCQ